MKVFWWYTPWNTLEDGYHRIAICNQMCVQDEMSFVKDYFRILILRLQGWICIHIIGCHTFCDVSFGCKNQVCSCTLEKLMHEGIQLVLDV